MKTQVFCFLLKEPEQPATLDPALAGQQPSEAGKQLCPVNEPCALLFTTDPTTPYCLPHLLHSFVLLAWPLWALEL